MVMVTWCRSASTRQRSTASISTSSTSMLSAWLIRSSACSRDRSMICTTRSASRADSMPIRAANRRTAVGLVGGLLDRLGEQRDGPDRGLQLVTHVRHEVPAGGFDPPRAGEVVGQHEDQTVRHRRDPDVEQQVGVAQIPGPSAHLDLLGQQSLLAAGLSGHLQHSGDHHPAAAGQPELQRVRRGLEHLVVRPDHHPGGPDHPQHLADALGNDDLADLGNRSGRRRAGPVGPAPRCPVRGRHR